MNESGGIFSISKLEPFHLKIFWASFIDLYFPIRVCPILLFLPLNDRIDATYEDKVENNYAQKAFQEASIALYMVLTIQQLGNMPIKWFAHKRVAEVASPNSNAQPEENLIDRL